LRERAPWSVLSPSPRPARPPDADPAAGTLHLLRECCPSASWRTSSFLIALTGPRSCGSGTRRNPSSPAAISRSNQREILLDPKRIARRVGLFLDLEEDETESLSAARPSTANGDRLLRNPGTDRNRLVERSDRHVRRCMRGDHAAVRLRLRQELLQEPRSRAAGLTLPAADSASAVGLRSRFFQVPNPRRSSRRSMRKRAWASSTVAQARRCHSALAAS